MYDDFKVKKNIHSNCLIEIKYEQVNIIINERKKINRQYKIIHLEILLKVQYRYTEIQLYHRNIVHVGISTLT